MMKKKVVLAFSGGLDTTYCALYLARELDYDVHTVLVNTGGFTKEQIKGIEAHALKLGVKSHKSIDATEVFYHKCIRYLIFGNCLRNHTYPLSVSAERVFQAREIAGYAKELKADFVAHGSTGAGNDQVRFDLIFQVLIPEIEILTPIRDMTLSRAEEVAYIKNHGIELSWEKAKYSVNKGLWGTSVGGEETLKSRFPLPESAFPSKPYANEEEKISLSFHKGEITAVNGENANPVVLIQILEKMASKFGIGRDIHVGDTIIGIKGRVGFEAAAPLLLIKAHQLLEKHVLTKWQQYWKDQLAVWYAMQIHEGQYDEAVLRDMELFFESSQERVTGTVFITLCPFRFNLEGIESDYDLMNEKFGAYGEMNSGWSGEDVKGFTKILGNSSKIYHEVGKR